MSRTLHCLRITWTAFCGIACVLLIVLWGKSVPIDGHIVILGDPVPIFLLAVLIAVLGYVPWIPFFWRFTLDTLLFVTALVAVVLWLIVNSVR